MTATATTMVKNIWQSYFNVPGQKKEGEEGEGAPAEEAPAAKVGWGWGCGWEPWQATRAAAWLGLEGDHASWVCIC